jgi:EF-hand domain-containing family member B
MPGTRGGNTSTAYPYRAAGTSDAGGGGNAKECLDFPARPRTPPEYAKYRKSTKLAPGQRSSHYGIADDLKTMNLTAETFGVQSDRGNGSAAELINHNQLTALQRMNIEKAEKVYVGAAREPLGRSIDRGNHLPDKFTIGNAPFGRPGASASEPAKTIIWPEVNADQIEGDEIYKRSHGNYAPGEQKCRNYNWYVDPVTTRFGVGGKNIALNGVSKDVAEVLSGAGETKSIINTKQVEDFRNMGDMLGKTKNLGQDSAARPFETAYGRSAASGRAGGWSAAQVIKGKYTLKQQEADHDLGKSITPGFRNISLEDRAYGCPSIRTDLPKGDPMKRSVSDSQNYGDDVPAQDLISPPAFSDMSLEPTTFQNPKSSSEIRKLFEKINIHLEDEVFDAIWNDAGPRGNMVSLNAFRNCLNEYLDDVEIGNEAAWRARRGVSAGNLQAY